MPFKILERRSFTKLLSGLSDPIPMSLLLSEFPIIIYTVKCLDGDADLLLDRTLPRCEPTELHTLPSLHLLGTPTGSVAAKPSTDAALLPRAQHHAFPSATSHTPLE